MGAQRKAVVRVIRFYRPEDGPRLREIFAKQKLPVDLPLPDKDPAACIAMVLVDENDRPEMAVILRMTVEAHFVVDPDGQGNAIKLLRLRDQVEGAAKERSRTLEAMKQGAIVDGFAEVPKGCEDMHEIMELLGFRKSRGEFVTFCRSLYRRDCEAPDGT